MKGKEISKAVTISIGIMVCFSAFLIAAQNSSAEPVELVFQLDELSSPRAISGVAIDDNGQIYVIGGKEFDVMSSDFTFLDSVLIYDTETGVTSIGNNMTYGVAGSATSMGADGKIYVLGGYNDTTGYTNHTQIYSPTLDSWEMGTPAPANLFIATAVTGTDGKIYIWGSEMMSNSTLIYDPISDSWSFGTDLPSPRFNPSVVVINDTAIYVIGGTYMSMGSTIVDVYNPISDTWSSASSLNIAKTYAGAALGSSGYIFSFGGTDGFSLDTAPQFTTIERYEIETDTWTTLWWPVLQYPVSNFGTVVDELGNIYTIGGWSSGAVIPNISVIKSADLDVDVLKIIAPSDGSIVCDVVAIQASLMNPWNGITLMELWIDGTLREIQYGGTTSWIFIWDTTGLSDNSSHKIKVMGYNQLGLVSSDEVMVKVSAKSTEDKIDNIEDDIENISGSLDDFSEKIDELNESMSGNMDDLSDSVADTIDDIQDDVATTNDNADTAKTYAMIGMFIAIIIAVLVAVNIVMVMMSRRKP